MKMTGERERERKQRKRKIYLKALATRECQFCGKCINYYIIGHKILSHKTHIMHAIVYGVPLSFLAIYFSR
jgi:hypothetical protein